MKLESFLDWEQFQWFNCSVYIKRQTEDYKCTWSILWYCKYYCKNNSWVHKPPKQVERESHSFEIDKETEMDSLSLYMWRLKETNTSHQCFLWRKRLQPTLNRKIAILLKKQKTVQIHLSFKIRDEIIFFQMCISLILKNIHRRSHVFYIGIIRRWENLKESVWCWFITTSN